MNDQRCQVKMTKICCSNDVCITRFTNRIVDECNNLLPVCTLSGVESSSRWPFLCTKPYMDLCRTYLSQLVMSTRSLFPPLCTYEKSAGPVCQNELSTVGRRAFSVAWPAVWNCLSKKRLLLGLCRPFVSVWKLICSQSLFLTLFWTTASSFLT